MASSPNKRVKRKYILIITGFPEVGWKLSNRSTLDINPAKNIFVENIAPMEYKIVFMIFILDSPC